MHSHDVSGVDRHSEANDSFYDDLSGIEDMVGDINGKTNEQKDKYEQFKKFHEADDPLEAFCKAKGINYNKCTPREYYKGEGSQTIIFSQISYYRPEERCGESLNRFQSRRTI